MTHELTLLADVMRRIERVAAEEGAERVIAVRLWLGALAHISADHLREHFEEAARGGIAEGARVEIEESRDLEDPNAQEIVLVSVEVEDR